MTEQATEELEGSRDGRATCALVGQGSPIIFGEHKGMDTGSHAELWHSLSPNYISGCDSPGDSPNYHLSLSFYRQILRTGRLKVGAESRSATGLSCGQRCGHSPALCDPTHKNKP